MSRAGVIVVVVHAIVCRDVILFAANEELLVMMKRNSKITLNWVLEMFSNWPLVILVVYQGASNSCDK